MQIQPNLNKIHTWKWLNYFQSIKNMNICPFYIEIGGVRHYGIGWPPQSYENTIEVLKKIIHSNSIYLIQILLEQLLIVVDGSMVAEHKNEVKFYVLNIIKMVSYLNDLNLS